MSPVMSLMAAAQDQGTLPQVFPAKGQQVQRATFETSRHQQQRQYGMFQGPKEHQTADRQTDRQASIPNGIQTTLPFLFIQVVAYKLFDFVPVLWTTAAAAAAAAQLHPYSLEPWHLIFWWWIGSDDGCQVRHDSTF
jgi:hypothetical protein